jgi:hypothetical protein
MNTSLTIPHLQVLWVVGALERLATIGMLDPDVRYHVSQEHVDTFLAVDDLRNELFPYEEVIGTIFKAITNDLDEAPDDDEIEVITTLILEYKNNRTEMVKYAMSNSHD